MTILDFIFREKYISPPSGHSVLDTQPDSDGASRSSAASASASPRPSSVPPYIQLYQPRAPAASRVSPRSTVPSTSPHGTAVSPANASAPPAGEQSDSDGQQHGYHGKDAQAVSGAVVVTSAADGRALVEASEATPQVSAPPQADASLALTATSTSTAASPFASASSPHGLGLNDCRSRACAGVIDTFKKALRPPGASQQSSAAPTELGTSETAVGAGAGADAAALATGVAVTAAAAEASAAGEAGADIGGGGGPDGPSGVCPPDTWQLGRATWTFLHSVAAHYPDRPTPRQQELMRGMMEGLAEFYPCQICAEHLREQVGRSPPQVATAKDLNLWLCGIHNEVNEMLGKPLFDCSRLLERWRDGPPDGSCD